MLRKHFLTRAVPALLLLAALPAGAQNFMVQCPTSTLLHPSAPTSVSGEPTYTGPQALNTTANGVSLTYISNGGAVKCQHISGGDGYMTEADGNQTYMFSFGPLSGLDKIQNGQPGTDFPDEFNRPYCDSTGAYTNGQPNPYSPTGGVNPLNPTAPPDPRFNCGANGAVGYVPPPGARQATGTTALGSATQNVATCPTAAGCRVSGITVVDPGAGYTAAPTVSIDPPPCTINGTTCVRATAIAVIGTGSVIEAAIQIPGAGYINAPNVRFSAPVGTSLISGTDPAAIMNTGTMNGNIPAPLMAFDEDDEFFLTLTNVGMIMRPDLFEQHTVHFHGYPNASSFYDGVPDASLAINIGASFTYYYLAPDAGTYFWHCHITPPEHLQMGMVGQLYVRPRQNRLPNGAVLYYSVVNTTGTTAIGTATGPGQQGDLRTACYSMGESNLYAGKSATTAPVGPSADILCSTPAPAANNSFAHVTGYKYVYNDGDGTTRYDIDVPIQIHGFDPNFHFVGMTFNSEGFSDMKDKYFLLNGRSYPDTVGVPPGATVDGNVLPATWTGGVSGATNPDPNTFAISTAASDAFQRPSQPISTLIVLKSSGAPCGPGQTPSGTLTTCGQRAALRIADLDVSEYQTLASLGIPMQVVGYNAKLLRDQAGNNLYYTTNSITLGGGESLDVIIDSTGVPAGTYFLYTPNLDHLSNDAENFGGLMTEVVVTP
jgi:Multicopper oxidase